MILSEIKGIWKFLKFLFLLLGVFLSFFILAEIKGVYIKLYALHPYVAYFFGVVISSILALLLYNTLSIFRRKPVTVLYSSVAGKKYIKLLIKFTKHLSRNQNIDEDDKIDLELGIKKIRTELKKNGQNLQVIADNFKNHDIELILEKLDEKVQKVISDSVVKVAALTLIPNKISDFFFAMYVNVNMIYKISKIYDSRPKLKEGFLIVEDVIAVMGTSAVMNFVGRSAGNIISGGLSGIPIIGGFFKAGGGIINEFSQAVAVGFMTSIAGHSAQRRFRPLQEGDSDKIRQSLVSRAKEYFTDVKGCVMRLFGRKKGTDKELGKIDSFMLDSKGSVLLNNIIFYTLFQEVQSEKDDTLKKGKQRYLDRTFRILAPDTGIEYDYELGKYNISREKIIEDLKKLEEREKSILFIETYLTEEYRFFHKKRFKELDFSEKNIKKEIVGIAIDAGKAEDFIDRVWETKVEAENVYKSFLECVLPFAAGTVAAGILIPVTGVPALIGGIIGSNFLGYSGVVAVNAGLAWLGGGSLVAGGFGMAGGATLLTGLGAGLGASGGAIFSKIFRKDVRDNLQLGKLIEQCYLKLVLLEEEGNIEEVQQLIKKQQEEIEAITERKEEMKDSIEDSEEENKDIKKQINEAEKWIGIIKKAIEWENKQIDRAGIISRGANIPGIDICKACRQAVRRKDAVTGSDGLLYHKQCYKGGNYGAEN